MNMGVFLCRFLWPRNWRHGQCYILLWRLHLDARSWYWTMVHWHHSESNSLSPVLQSLKRLKRHHRGHTRSKMFHDCSLSEGGELLFHLAKPNQMFVEIAKIILLQIASPTPAALPPIRALSLPLSLHNERRTSCNPSLSFRPMASFQRGFIKIAIM